MITLLSIIFTIASILLVILVLLQSGKGAGMGLFGGGGSNTTFGAQGGNILTRITTILGIVFFGIAIIFAVHSSAKSDSVTDDVKAGNGKRSASSTRMQYPADTIAVKAKDDAGNKKKGTTATNARTPGR